MYHHRVPCYGDLTPGIPDVVETKTAARIASLLPENLYRRSGGQESLGKKDISPDLLHSCFACLRLRAGTGDLKVALAVARDFSPRVMTAGDAEILLDVSGLGRLIGPPGEIARQLAHAIVDARVRASVAIGPTQTIARLLAHADARGARREPGGAGGMCEPVAAEGRDRASRLAPRASDVTWLPVDLLQELEALPPTMNDRDRVRPYETFERWGIVTIGDLAALPAADLSSRLGRRGVALQQLARGLDVRPFVPDAATSRFIERLELEWPIDSLEPLSFVLARLLDPLSLALERADRGAIAIRLELRLTDRSTFTRVLPLPLPMREARVLRTLIMLALESGPPPAGIDIVSIELDPAPARIVRYSLFDRALPSPETLATLTARLSALVGKSRVGSAVLLDSHAPDAFAMARFALDGAGRADRAESAGRADRAESAGRADRAEGAGGAGAERADGAKGAVLRRQRTSTALRVSVEEGRPVYIAPSRRGIPYGAIAQAAGPWRTSGHWWTESRWNRNEWDVALKSGAVCRIYRDRTTERWFLEGVYD